MEKRKLKLQDYDYCYYIELGSYTNLIKLRNPFLLLIKGEQVFLDTEDLLAEYKNNYLRGYLMQYSNVNKEQDTILRKLNRLGKYANSRCVLTREDILFDTKHLLGTNDVEYYSKISDLEGYFWGTFFTAALTEHSKETLLDFYSTIITSHCGSEYSYKPESIANYKAPFTKNLIPYLRNNDVYDLEAICELIASLWGGRDTYTIGIKHLMSIRKAKKGDFGEISFNIYVDDRLTKDSVRLWWNKNKRTLLNSLDNEFTQENLPKALWLENRFPINYYDVSQILLLAGNILWVNLKLKDGISDLFLEEVAVTRAVDEYTLV